MATTAASSPPPSLVRPVSSPTRYRAQWWTSGGFIIVSHIVFIWTLIRPLPHSWTTLTMAVLFAWLNLLGVTAGYHRLWSHRAYDARGPLRVFLAAIGAMSFQGSIKWWATKHRLHHRFVDTPFDPHDSTKGFWYSHLGWLIQPPPDFTEKLKLIDIEDLNGDYVVRAQAKCILLAYLILGGVLPGVLGMLIDGSFLVGVLYIGSLSRIISWHCIWSINSVSHFDFHSFFESSAPSWLRSFVHRHPILRVFGTREYSVHSSAIHFPLIEFFQNGEGNHNYHHEFPHDYRHGIKWYSWDPTKWMIDLWDMMGLVKDKRIVNKGVVLSARKRVLREKFNRWANQSDGKDPNNECSQLRFPASLLSESPIDASLLPAITLSEYRNTFFPSHKHSFIISSLVIDFSLLRSNHPGGSAVLLQYAGKDATTAFFGGLNGHSDTAKAVMRRMAIAKIGLEGGKGDDVSLTNKPETNKCT